MKKLLPILPLLALTLTLTLIPSEAESQCAMCKAVAESDQKGGSAVADGLNTGIIYLMSFPYILMLSVGYAIYRHKKQQS